MAFTLAQAFHVNMQQPGNPIKAQGSLAFLCKIVFFDCARCHAARSKPARAFCSAEDIEQLPFTVVGTARWLSKSCTNTNTKTKTVTPNKNTQTHKRKYPNTTLHSCWHHLSYTESEKPRQRVSNADRKVFANPESFCDKFIFG